MQRNAEKEEAKHQAKIRELREAEDAQETDEDRLRVRKEILYGRKRSAPIDESLLQVADKQGCHTRRGRDAA